jgi:hypothetical protein
MSDHLIAEANRHAMTLPTTHPTHADIAWYERELVLANEHKDDWMALHYAIQSECAKLRAALTAALSVLDEHAEEERKFWGAEDKHGLASEAEKIHDQARAALSSPNVAAEPRAAKTQETPRSSAACAAWESGLGDGPSVSLVFAQRLDCELIALTAERDQLRAELAAEREKAERYRLATLRLDAELAAEREKVRTLRLACDQICEEWGINHEANPIGAGQRMSTRAGKALEATEDGA